jgi:hypothetical protein
VDFDPTALTPDWTKANCAVSAISKPGFVTLQALISKEMTQVFLLYFSQDDFGPDVVLHQDLPGFSFDR